jgi:hypothetical protein
MRQTALAITSAVFILVRSLDGYLPLNWPNAQAAVIGGVYS